MRWRATSQAHIAVKTLRQDFSTFFAVRSLPSRSRNNQERLDLMPPADLPLPCPLIRVSGDRDRYLAGHVT
jgi:hypothetical protein